MRCDDSMKTLMLEKLLFFYFYTLIGKSCFEKNVKSTMKTYCLEETRA